MLVGPAFTRALREAAPHLSKRFFSCQNLANRPSTPRFGLPTVTRIPIHSRPNAFTGFHRPCSSQIQSTRSFSASVRASTDAVTETSQQDIKLNKSRFPDTSSNTVAYWLLASAASVFGIVVFGGLTRLTESGLSITEWRPVTGSLPPLSDADWASEFLKYQSSPEFHLLNSRMTLDEFKSIYWMEWIHRLWGRAVGLTFVIPAVYFVARKQVSKPMMLRLGGIAGLIGFQGFIGWWMVKSGLKDDLFAPGSHPRVSQYRLTAHLGAAFVCYIAMFWNGLAILRTNKLLSMSPTNATSTLFALRNPALKPFKISVALLAALVFTTAMSGGLVAGLDAGLIYNEFPYMGVGLTPPKSELFDSFYSRDPERRDLWWRNALENPSLVQLDHRILATTTFTAVMALFAYSRLNPNMVSFLPPAAKRGMHGVVGFVWLQVILGITTLWYLVPLPLASAHQAGSLALLTWTFVLGSRVWYPTAAAKVLAKRMAASGGGLKGPALPGIGKTISPAAAEAAAAMKSREAGKASRDGAAVLASTFPLAMLAGMAFVQQGCGPLPSSPNSNTASDNESVEGNSNSVDTTSYDQQRAAFLQRQSTFNPRTTRT